MGKVYIYVVDRDLGFAPNPFHGFCTLATCKPRIRNVAKVDDWVIGMGGGRLNATGRCVFAMKITQIVPFNEYWLNPEFNDKKPIRNGSKKMMLGDNIYFYNSENSIWLQAHSHHSLADGSVNNFNLERDTKSSNVLISKHYYYFGKSAPIIPANLLSSVGYRNMVGHRVYDYNIASQIIKWIENNYCQSLNFVLSEPFNFDKGDAHYSVETNKIT